jgi:hypothetical protein
MPGLVVFTSPHLKIFGPMTLVKDQQSIKRLSTTPLDDLIDAAASTVRCHWHARSHNSGNSTFD